MTRTGHEVFKRAGLTIMAALMAAFGTAHIAHAASATGDHKMEHQDWGFNGMFGTYDKAAAQRGFQIYKDVCAACHDLEHLDFRHLGDKGGPFYDPENPNPNDNPVVKAIADQWIIKTPDTDSDTGDMIERNATPADPFPRRFANEAAARYSNAGALPPDLSLIVKARNGGADYLYDIMMSYTDAPDDLDMPAGMYYNPAFEGSQIAMAPPLQPMEGLLEYAPMMKMDSHGEMVEIAAPEATAEQMARDVTEFLAWAADPKLEVRKKMGLGVMLYLLIFAVLTFLTYKQVWRHVKH